MSDSLLLVFNELSVPIIPGDLETTKAWLVSFADVLADPRGGTRRVFVSPPNFPHFQVCAGYSIGRWLKTQNKHDEPRWRRVNSLLDRRRDFSWYGPQNDGDSEYRHSGQLAEGLPLALREDGLAISFRSDDSWDTASVVVEKSWVGQNDIETCTFAVPHASRLSHLDANADWLQRWEADPTTGQELWDRREELFPNLDFCAVAEGQIRELRGTEVRFNVVLRGLTKLQDYCASWNEPQFSIRRVGNASGESESTLNRYSRERTFRCPDNQDRVFNWHLKRGDTRIHFVDFPATKRLLIGYVGSHLPISTD